MILKSMKYKVGEVEGKNKFHQRDHCTNRRIATLLPSLPRSNNAVLRGSAEFGFPIEDGFQNTARVVNRKPYAQRQNKREEPDFTLPGSWIKLSLSTKVKNSSRYRCCDENR